MTDEDQRALAVKTVAAVFMPLACIAVILRCYVRARIVKGFGWDDGAMVIAAVISLDLHRLHRGKLTKVRYSMSCFALA